MCYDDKSKSVLSDRNTESLMDPEVREALSKINAALGADPTDAPVKTSVGIKEKTEQVTSLVDKIKDNIAYIVGLPATLGGAFGFLTDHSDSKAQLEFQVQQLEEAVAEMKAENSLLGGGTKNFALDMSAAPGGSVTVIIVAGGLFVLLGLLVWYQRRRRN